MLTLWVPLFCEQKAHNSSVGTKWLLLLAACLHTCLCCAKFNPDAKAMRLLSERCSWNFLLVNDFYFSEDLEAMKTWEVALGILEVISKLQASFFFHLNRFVIDIRTGGSSNCTNHLDIISKSLIRWSRNSVFPTGPAYLLLCVNNIY